MDWILGFMLDIAYDLRRAGYGRPAWAISGAFGRGLLGYIAGGFGAALIGVAVGAVAGWFLAVVLAVGVVVAGLAVAVLAGYLALNSLAGTA